MYGLTDERYQQLVDHGIANYTIEGLIRYYGLDVVQKGYMQCRQEYYNESSAVIPNAMHIEHVPQLATFDCVWDACRQAEKDGVMFINDMEGLEKGFYVDTPENRKICADGLKQYPNLRIENWLDIEDGDWGSGYAEYFLKEKFAQTDEMAVEPEQLTRRLNVTVMCQAVYNSGIDVPADLPFEQALSYAKEHIADIPLGTMEYVPDSDVLDEENCDFEEERPEKKLDYKKQEAENIFSLSDVLHALRECDRSERYEGMFEHMLTFASELTGISEDALCSSMYPEQEPQTKEPDPWEELHKKYPKDRSEMSEPEEREFVNECYALYEQEGFSPVFWTTWSDQEFRKGQPFEVVGRCTPENRDLCTLPMWKIRFPDGAILEAYPEEIIPREMRATGCPVFDKQTTAIDSLIQNAENKRNVTASNSPEKEFGAER